MTLSLQAKKSLHVGTPSNLIFFSLIITARSGRQTIVRDTMYVGFNDGEDGAVGKTKVMPVGAESRSDDLGMVS